MSPAVTKELKIGGIVLLVAIVVYIVYRVFKGGAATGNKYGSAEAVAAGKSGSDGAYTSTGNDGFSELFNLGITGEYSPGIYNADAYGQAWFKGMNIKESKANVAKYGTEVAAYAASSFAKPHWNVTVGEFLK